jgi:ribosomal protein L11 methyltransferase
MGAGTGILGILADRMGAKLVDAIDIEEWAYENMLENAERNQCQVFNAYHGGLEVLQRLDHTYDLIIANINKNILFDQLDEYRAKLKAGGVIFLSGFFETDQVDFESYANEHGMRIDRAVVKEDWTALKLV